MDNKYSGNESGIDLPVGFFACERGNVYLSFDDIHLAWYRCGPGVWLEVSICTCNYPATSVTTFRPIS